MRTWWRHDFQHNDTLQGLFVTLSINDTQHNKIATILSVFMLSVVIYSYCYAECHYAECCGAFVV